MNTKDIYSQEYLERLKSLELKRKVILDVLRDYKNISKHKISTLERNLERPEKIGLTKVNPIVFSFLLNSLFTINESIEYKIIEFERNKVSRYILFEILFWAKPSTFAFPNEDVKNYKEFMNKKRKRLREFNLENYLQLYALESSEKDTFIREISKKALEIQPENVEDYIWMRDFIFYLDPMEKNKIKSKLHPYVWKVLSNTSGVPVIIDGNNVLMSNKLVGSEKIDVLLSLIAKLDRLYFPFYIVFDENAKYKFKTKYFNYKRVYFHSPADELIIALAKEIKGVVCSMDKFKEYELVENIWYKLKL
ncbi:MAG: ribonuclease [Fervidobacterium sp.]